MVVFVRGLRRRRVETGRVVAERVGGWNSAEADRGVCVCVCGRRLMDVRLKAGGWMLKAGG